MSKEVVICPECKGEGQMAYIENRETHVDKCKTCEGSGRVLVETKITIKPYGIKQ